MQRKTPRGKWRGQKSGAPTVFCREGGTNLTNLATHSGAKDDGLTLGIGPLSSLQPICSCFSLIFLKITCSCLARERTAVSVRFIRIPIALELSPVSANLRSLSSSACVHGREATCAGSVIGRLEWRATSFKALSMSEGIDHFPMARGLRKLPDSRSSSHFAYSASHPSASAAARNVRQA
jgi:hypothetical protein